MEARWQRALRFVRFWPSTLHITSDVTWGVGVGWDNDVDAGLRWDNDVDVSWGLRWCWCYMRVTLMGGWGHVRCRCSIGCESRSLPRKSTYMFCQCHIYCFMRYAWHSVFCLALQLRCRCWPDKSAREALKKVWRKLLRPSKQTNTETG